MLKKLWGLLLYQRNPITRARKRAEWGGRRKEGGPLCPEEVPMSIRGNQRKKRKKNEKSRSHQAQKERVLEVNTYWGGET